MDRSAASDNLAHAEMIQAGKWLSQIPRLAQYYGVDFRRSVAQLRCSLTAPITPLAEDSLGLHPLPDYCARPPGQD